MTTDQPTHPFATPPASATRALDPREYRDVLGTFTTGVTIVTATGADGVKVGVTANSFTSVSLDPPLVLWSLARTSQSLRAFDSSSHWAVHILSQEQEALSGRFARRGEDKFLGVDTQGGLGGAPLLAQCTARLQCRTAHRYDGGDHVIYVGEVMQLERSELPPLVYQSGAYAIATRKESPELPLPRTPGAPPNPEIESSIGYLLGSTYLQLFARIRAYASERGLNDAELFVLTALAARDGRSFEEFDALFMFAGQNSGGQGVFDDLRARNLIRVDEPPTRGSDNSTAQLFLTSEGAACSRDLIAAGFKIESEITRQLGSAETAALRMLLQKLMRTTNVELSYRWV